MHYKKILLFLFLIPLLVSSQEQFKGLWKGMISESGSAIKDADVLYIRIDVQNNSISGRTRIELQDNENMAIKSFKGSLEDNKLILEEDYVRSSSNTRKAPVCKLNYTLVYNDSTGYLSGSYVSSDCRRIQGQIVLYRTEGKLNETKVNDGNHLWQRRFLDRLEKGYPSPEILDKERKNFSFEPIYFDHDKAEIRPEHYDYLNKLARILGGIHDLRIEVIGHTDAVGSDQYNIGLSERRAKAIKDYFKQQGIEPEKLEIDFKGERQPVDTNETANGKQRNRRVDFKFI
jgi:outer membrane protein OmpA-like peptidoglycan-associated protein